MSSQLDRLKRERHTIQVMTEIYCHGHHQNRDKLCADCHDLFTYAMKRIDKCPLQADKPTCAQCPVHCYKRDMREKIRFVMRYSGPRMLVYHPILTILHYRDEITKKHTPRSNDKART
jgi:predicted amidophosphoribosyltransferase